ncbi:GGDEF domain-containing protein [Hydrogenimonas thermophila]|uniref:GGDEF domain-containing protein n=1 Tax=Hydrogenimonas thermophila TaxID=223786 RepID=UPI002936E700|nr:GGDEF domain-containing protein [Hydrogenimonas thermophila]WOE70924.1 GGDEF domain-containing protein [Hydrogenimonas thermophila]WOE73442.1 GGDEF domain-containing protein [Hydrogenimonas thermophila]
MDSLISLKKTIQESCQKIESYIESEEIKEKDPFEVVSKSIEILFEQMSARGYKMYIDEYLDTAAKKFTTECFDIAKQSVESFKLSNVKIEDITKTHTFEIDSIINAEEKSIDLNHFKKSFNLFQYNILNELESANNTIKDLEKEIEELQKQSNIDPMTKLYNRKALKNDLELLHQISQDKQINTTIMMIDVDDFKKINDQFGHLAGDKVLILLSRLIKSAIRETDKAYRYGGEELLIIFNRAKIEDAKIVAERILNTVRSNKIIYKGNVIKMTLSIGMTAYKAGDTPEKLIERADSAVYEAKRRGKDRLVIK